MRRHAFQRVHLIRFRRDPKVAAFRWHRVGKHPKFAANHATDSTELQAATRGGGGRSGGHGLPWEYIPPICFIYFFNILFPALLRVKEI